jgi:hypothetical protein
MWLIGTGISGAEDTRAEGSRVRGHALEGTRLCEYDSTKRGERSGGNARKRKIAIGGIGSRRT